MDSVDIFGEEEEEAGEDEKDILRYRIQIGFVRQFIILEGQGENGTNLASIYIMMCPFIF